MWLKALILPFCFVFIDKYSVLRGVAGEGEKEGENNSKWHLNISPFQVYNDCVDVSLRTQHRMTCLTVCADWVPCLSSRSPPTCLSLQLSSLSPHHCPSAWSRLSFLLCLRLFWCLPACTSACVSIWPLHFYFIDFSGSFESSYFTCAQTHTNIYIWIPPSPPSPSLSLSVSLLPVSFCLHTPMCTPHTHTRCRQMAHLPGKLLIHALTPRMSTLLAWVVQARTRPQTPPPVSPPPPITNHQHVATFPARWLCSTPTNPPTRLNSTPKWEWPPSPPHLPPQGYTYNRG